MIRGPGTLNCGVYGGNSIGEVSGEGTGVNRVESLVELIHLGNPEDHRVSVRSVQDAMERRPPQRSCVPADSVLLSCFQNSDHGRLDGGFAIKETV